MRILQRAADTFSGEDCWVPLCGSTSWEHASQGRLLGLPVRFRILTWPFPCLLDLPLNFKMATNTSTGFLRTWKWNASMSFRTIFCWPSVLRLLVAHRRHLRVGSGNTGCSPSGMGFWGLGWANFFLLEWLYFSTEKIESSTTGNIGKATSRRIMGGLGNQERQEIGRSMRFGGRDLSSSLQPAGSLAFT